MGCEQVSRRAACRVSNRSLKGGRERPGPGSARLCVVFQNGGALWLVGVRKRLTSEGSRGRQWSPAQTERWMKAGRDFLRHRLDGWVKLKLPGGHGAERH